MRRRWGLATAGRWSARRACPVVLVLVGLLTACAGEPPVPTARVERRPWTREVLAEGFLKAVKATPLTAPTDAQRPMRIEWLLADGSVVAAGDSLVRFAAHELEVELESARRDGEGVGLKRAGQRVQRDVTRTKAELEIGVAHAELAVAERMQPKDELVFSRNERIQAELDAALARQREEHAESVRTIGERVAAGEAELIEVEGRQVTVREDRAEAGLAALAVTAPHDGLFVLARGWRGETTKLGDTLWPGQPFGEIPDTRELEAEVFVLEADAGGLAVDLPARVILEARPDERIEAKVKRVDKVAKPRRRGLAVQYFGATLSLAATDPAWMKPGARVRAWLELARREEALVVPEAALVDEGERRIVFRRRGDDFEPLPVVVEAAGGGVAVLAEAGDAGARLAVGDEVALVDPRPAEQRGRATSGTPQTASPSPSTSAAPGTAASAAAGAVRARGGGG